MRIRSVRPEFFSDEKMPLLTYGARLLYIGLWCYVDDYGRGEYLPKRIEGEVFPLESVDFEAVWLELEKLDRVVRYRVDGKELFYIPSFEDHQKPRQRYDSKLPSPDDPRAESALSLTADSLNPVGVPPVDVGVDVDVEAAAAPDPDAAPVENPEFEEFHQWRMTVKASSKPNTKNVGALAFFLSNQPDELAESERIYGHRDCPRCRGSGFTETYGPGSGMVKVECEGDSDEGL